ncbi:hypothetical protein K1T71_014149 [Dendrolimus kikuchii]|uniref:Uncharacterized protein n=1 Tax=Dendrolimus kikuchii TaxID=765133 RepID=A0ACC1CF91_9NEOP|nr:hypothetical protein K1T71_014149 [Dendrolimus kikuchii]
MAMVEEFEYVSYVCAYCGSMNPARKKRPMAPLLSSQPLDDDSPLISSASDSEDEKVVNNVSQNEGSERESDRPPSPKEEAPKSDEEKKED